jgi:hypothetical protein
VAGPRPNEAPLIRLVGAVLSADHDDWQAGDRLPFSEGSMAKFYPERDTDAERNRSGGRKRRMHDTFTRLPLDMVRLLPVIAFALLVQRHILRGMTLGAVKG